MKTNVRTVLNLFESKRRYIVPMFQRQYVWSLEKQWKPLWEDIEQKVIERLRWNEKLITADAEDKRNAEENPPTEHFLGAIVLDIHRTFGDEVMAQLVIDGQQRLTTCQVLLAALLGAARKHDVQDYVSELDGYVVNKGIMADPRVEKYKVWPTEFDQPAFRLAIDAGGLDDVMEHYSTKGAAIPRLVAAYRFFALELDAFLTKETVSDRLSSQPTTHQRVKALFEALQNDLQVVSIELEGHDDPQIIFETLNARGEPLLPSDLLRNYFFWRASREGSDVAPLYEIHWKPFDTDFWKKEETQGRLKRPRVDLFFFNFLQLKTGNEVNVSRLYHEYREWSERPSRKYPSTADELIDIDRHAVELRKLLEPDEATPIGRFAHVLQIFDVKTVFPLVLKLMVDRNLSESEIEPILQDLESYVIRRQICGMTSKAYNRTFVTWIAKLAEQPSPPGDGLHKTLRSIMLAEDSDSALWPSNARLISSWLNDALYTRMKSHGRMEHILLRLELASRSAKHEDVKINTGLTVEHVLPQQWIEHWPLPDGSRGVAIEDRLRKPSPDSDRRDRLLHTIGNLTLLTGSLNTAVTNHPFDVKVSQIEGYSLLALNQYFRHRAAAGQGWNEDSIVERGRALFESAILLWPHPAEESPTMS